jgi:hypothetical protein
MQKGREGIFRGGFRYFYLVGMVLLEGDFQEEASAEEAEEAEVPGDKDVCKVYK